MHGRTVILLWGVLYVLRVHVSYAGERAMRTLIGHFGVSEVVESKSNAVFEG